jgi:hypothetical protein
MAFRFAMTVEKAVVGRAAKSLAERVAIKPSG